MATLIYVIGWVVFLVLGSGDVQPWAIETETLDVCLDHNTSPLSESADRNGVQNGKAVTDGCSVKAETDELTDCVKDVNGVKVIYGSAHAAETDELIVQT